LRAEEPTLSEVEGIYALRFARQICLERSRNDLWDTACPVPPAV